MALEITRGDITRFTGDAVVNAANESLLGGGGVDGAIHRAAGPGLLEECRKLGGCCTGEAKITGGHRLAARYIIHTPGPVYDPARKAECREKLESCYRNALSLARRNGCRSAAFPLISAGVYGYPKQEALETAVRVIQEYGADLETRLILLDPEAVQLARKNFPDLWRESGDAD